MKPFANCSEKTSDLSESCRVTSMTVTNVVMDRTNYQTDFHTMNARISLFTASMNRSQQKSSPNTKSSEKAQKDCDWISIYGWDWWRQVVSDAEAKVKANTSREDQ